MKSATSTAIGILLIITFGLPFSGFVAAHIFDWLIVKSIIGFPFIYDPMAAFCGIILIAHLFKAVFSKDPESEPGGEISRTIVRFILAPVLLLGIAWALTLIGVGQ